jgi:spore coat protein U-like protein
MFKLKFLIIFVAVVFLNSQQSYAQSSVKADIIANCSVNSPSFPFETYKPSKTESNSITATVTVSCNKMKQDIPYSLGLSKSKQLFIMNKGTEIMYYQLFTSANFATIWDDTNTISGIVKNNKGVGSDTRTIYAKILRNDIAKNTGAFNLRSDPVIINLYYLP